LFKLGIIAVKHNVGCIMGAKNGGKINRLGGMKPRFEG